MCIRDRYPNIRVEGDDKINFAVSCRHCEDPLCVKACISGALHRKDGRVCIDKTKCVGCFSCIMVCPYGSLSVGENGTASKMCIRDSTRAAPIKNHTPKTSDVMASCTVETKSVSYTHLT